MSISNIIEQVLDKQDLSQQQSQEVMQKILAGEILPAQIASLLTALRAKGEAVEELVGFASAMRNEMVRLETPFPLVADNCGTGGDGKDSFNISTAAAFVVAGTGIPVAKHGNRSVSSKCGSADLLESCGVKLNMDLQTAKHCLVDVGITFLFAPLYHPAMKNVGAVRREMGIRTVFNLLGPLCNPAQAKAQVIGVAHKKFVPLLAKVFAKLNQNNLSCALVLNDDGYDEWVLGSNPTVSEVFEGVIKGKKISPELLGIQLAKAQSFAGTNLKENTELLYQVLTEKKSRLRSVVLANAALSIYAFKKASLQKVTLKDCAQMAQESIDTTSALQKLQGLIKVSHR